MSLAQVLSDIGVDVKREDSKEITGKCPVHLRRTGREDGHPSWSMNASTGLWICFSCGARGTLPMLVQELTGSADTMTLVHNVIIEAGIKTAAIGKGVKTSVQLTNDDLIKFGQFSSVPKKKAKRRSLEQDLLEEYSIRWDDDDHAFIIPIVSLTGEMMGWQCKGNGWVKNYPEGVIKSDTLFGVHHLGVSASPKAVLVESPLDVVRWAAVWDFPRAVASFGSYVSDKQIRLLSRAVDGLVVAMDNDPAGVSSTSRLFRVLPNFRSGVAYLKYPKGVKDVGDMSDDQIVAALESSAALPPWKC